MAFLMYFCLQNKTTVKKITARFFLTLATTLMLAATVVPHPHHRESICFINIHCEHEPAEEHHHHDDEPFRSGHCCLEYLFQTQIRMQDSEHSHCKGLCHHFAHTLFILPDTSSLFSYRAIGEASPRTVYREERYGFVPISDLAGRAPPFFIG